MELFLTMRKRADFPNMMTYTPEDMPMDVVLRALDIVAESGSWDFPQELQEVIKYAKMTVEQRAINDNILEKADKSGRKILECLFSTMGFKVIYTDDNATPAVYEPAEQLQ